MRYPRAIQSLIEKLSALPGVGPKTAERYAFHLLRQPDEKLSSLSEAIRELKEKTTRCHICLATSDTDPCPVCSDPDRNPAQLCVVEDNRDLAAIEGAGYKGRYFVLGGLIDTINEVKPDDLPFQTLVKRVKNDQVQEIIAALNFTLEGETTAMYITRLFKDQAKVTRLAKGLPAGSDLEYADELTLASALRNRNEINK